MEEEISIIIPVYNEEKRIELSLQKIGAYLEKNFKKYEIIIVNDGSKDRTEEIIQKYKDNKIRLIQNPKNMGKGFSVKNGMIYAQYDPILFTDVDLATPIEETEKFLNKIKEGYDVVIGSRIIEGAKISVQQPRYRRVLGKAFPLLVKNIVLSDFQDTQCGFKMFKQEAARKIFPRQTLRRWAFDVEVMLIAKKLGYKIKELPVTWTDQENSKLSPIKDSMKMFHEVMKVKYNSLKGKYKP